MTTFKLSRKQTNAPVIQIPQTDKDFLWSVVLGKSLRVYSLHQPYLYKWVIWKNDYRMEYELLYDCNHGQCVIGIPDVEGKSQFWTREISVIEQQMRDGGLILNGIPLNWQQLKRNANERQAT